MDKVLPLDSEELDAIPDFAGDCLVFYHYSSLFSNLQIEDKTISLLCKKRRMDEKPYKGL